MRILSHISGGKVAASLHTFCTNREQYTFFANIKNINVDRQSRCSPNSIIKNIDENNFIVPMTKTEEKKSSNEANRNSKEEIKIPEYNYL